MITVKVERNPQMYRYELTFSDREKLLEWFMFLDDEVLREPRRFNNWFKGVVEMIQLKGGQYT